VSRRGTFQGEYPKLLRFFSELCSRISQQTSTEGAVGEALSADMGPALGAIATFETNYLAQSLNRMFDPVQVCAPPALNPKPRPSSPPARRRRSYH